MPKEVFLEKNSFNVEEEIMSPEITDFRNNASQDEVCDQKGLPCPQISKFQNDLLFYL